MRFLFLLFILLCGICYSAPPKPVVFNWRESGEYPFVRESKRVIEYRESGIRIVQPGTSVALSDGDIRTPEEWLILIIDNWLRDDSNHVLHGNLWRDGVVNYRDFAVISRFWKFGQKKETDILYGEKPNLSYIAEEMLKEWMQ